ncbi:hypothetical protein [Maribacter sp. 4G9]|jgi:ketopantoate reductase|uniref:hypothetical protein n=1 Tax=Maribacter sp. 4G9 TaxID=1889777 RepID=UPI000C145237|nr:hypothetical protein [Maribacter sp. 4G9]PIB39075.1 hypothetical protein BFP75_00945 [Maribacter sp. 4G9]
MGSIYKYTIIDRTQVDVVRNGRGHMEELRTLLPSEIFAVIKLVDGTDGPLDIKVDTGKMSYEIKKSN